MNVDISQMKEFYDKLNHLQKEQKNMFLESCIKELAARFLSKVVLLTPVGKKPKIKVVRNKDNTVSKSSKAMLEIWKGYKGGGLRKAWKIKTPKKTANSHEIVVENTKEYASYVEYGHRQNVGRFVPAIGKRLKNNYVKGKFMMTKTEEEIKKITPQLLEKRLSQYLEGINGK